MISIDLRIILAMGVDAIQILRVFRSVVNNRQRLPTWSAQACVDGEAVASASAAAANGAALALDLPEPRAWSPADHATLSAELSSSRR